MTEDEIVVLRDESLPEKGNYRILVSVANPATAIPLARNCYRFCRGKGLSTEAEIIHMVPVPHQTPLSEAFRYTQAGEEAVTEAMLYLSQRYPVGSTMRYCRSFARGIVSAAAERRADLLIMGWKGHGRRGFSLGSTVDPVLERATCNVAVFKNCSKQKYMTVLVPVAGGPNGEFALETASLMVERDGGRVVLFNVAPPGEPTYDIDAFLESVSARADCPDVAFESKYAISRDRLNRIIEESANYDLVVLGATRDPLFRQFVMGSLPEELARRCDTPLIMVKAKNSLQSFIRRCF